MAGPTVGSGFPIGRSFETTVSTSCASATAGSSSTGVAGMLIQLGLFGGLEPAAIGG
jgi:hypothetical protein